VTFNGDKLWHRDHTAGGARGRVSLTLEYVTDPSMSAMKRLFSNLKDSFAYFGLKRSSPAACAASARRSRTQAKRRDQYACEPSAPPPSAGQRRGASARAANEESSIA